MGPWTRDNYGKVIGADGEQVCLTSFALWSGYVPPECHKDDDDVFRAVNSHDDLVAALEACKEHMKHSFNPLTVQIDAALAKAEGR